MLFAAGEVDGNAAVAESVVDSSEIINTLSGGGVSTVGYAAEDVERSSDRGLLSRVSGSGGSGNGGNRGSGSGDAGLDSANTTNRITSLVRKAALGRLTLPCDVQGAEKSLVVVGGPPEHLDRKGIERGRQWLEEETGSMEVRGGDYPSRRRGPWRAWCCSPASTTSRGSRNSSRSPSRHRTTSHSATPGAKTTSRNSSTTAPKKLDVAVLSAPPSGPLTRSVRSLRITGPSPLRPLPSPTLLGSPYFLADDPLLRVGLAAGTHRVRVDDVALLVDTPTSSFCSSAKAKTNLAVWFSSGSSSAFGQTPPVEILD